MYGNRIRLNILLLWLLAAPTWAWAQSVADRVVVGVYGGVNSALVLPLSAETVVLGNPGNGEKDYHGPTQNLGMQLGALLRYELSPMWVISLEPAWARYRWGYDRVFAWQGAETVRYMVHYTHQLQMADVPLFVEWRQGRRLETFVKGGAFVGFLLGAASAVQWDEDGLQAAQRNANVGSTNAWGPVQWGPAAGAGLRYAFGKLQVGVELAYRMPLSKLTSTRTRFANADLVGGYYDVADELLWQNLAVNVQLLSPFFRSGQGGGRSNKRGPVPCPTER